ncbi:ATP-grasp domain-containing protein [Tahibacter amnicola]|uniref:ATP-grasp domain-containing protein n=1 Tax=Tahibacter amnicola TaxID=2976241 RepID=A0ABY6BI97_9GAMM|nr:hypothetical protein [Tahibacter amnicola]UXI69232.1 hypothetical protein N4264_06175 [Tahibacter amnicola]
MLRSTWDYTRRLPEFLAWIDAASQRTRLFNPPEVVRRNTDKHYLEALAQAGVPVVPGLFLHPGEDPARAIARALERFTDPEFVVKPCVGAGSRDAQRYGRAQVAAATAHAAALLAAGRDVLIQPYLDRVDAQGETALIYFDGQFSHAIRKGPLLKPDEGPTRALFAAEHISAREPTAQERAVAERTLATIATDGPLLYARVDLIRDTADNPVVLELELSEPSLFFAHGEGSAARFAAAILRRLESVRTVSPAAAGPAR